MIQIVHENEEEGGGELLRSWNPSFIDSTNKPLDSKPWSISPTRRATVDTWTWMKSTRSTLTSKESRQVLFRQTWIPDGPCWTLIRAGFVSENRLPQVSLPVRSALLHSSWEEESRLRSVLGGFVWLLVRLHRESQTAFGHWKRAECSEQRLWKEVERREFPGMASKLRSVQLSLGDTHLSRSLFNLTERNNRCSHQIRSLFGHLALHFLGG